MKLEPLFHEIWALLPAHSVNRRVAFASFALFDCRRIDRSDVVDRSLLSSLLFIVDRCSC